MILALVCSGIGAQTKPARLPKFQDYSIREIFNQTPHAPLIVTAEQRRFRSRIREGAGKPNFAGHYSVITSGCESPCLRVVICDAITGVIYGPPLAPTNDVFAIPLLLFPNSVPSNPELEYRSNSELMVIRAMPQWYQSAAVPYTFYFLWRKNKWTLLRRVAILD
jgi:hypothetical protein